MADLARIDGRQVTMPLFDKALLKNMEEMAQDIVMCKSESGNCRMIIKGGVRTGAWCGNGRRIFAAGNIRTIVRGKGGS